MLWCLAWAVLASTSFRARGWQARAMIIIGVDINPDREEWGRKFGMTAFLNSKGMSREDVVAKIVLMTDGGADYTFDATGNTEVMRTALEACHRGWGTSIIIGVAEAGKEIATRPFQLVTGRNWRGTAFGGAKGRTDVPKDCRHVYDRQDRNRSHDHACHGSGRHQQSFRINACKAKASAASWSF
jgi:Zn-dependent alcohol dehydrogenase